MMDERTYKKEIVRMWDSIRDDKYKGSCDCDGVQCCEECALYDIKCGSSTNAFKMIEAVEKWSKEHHPLKLTRFEFEMLKWLEKEGYKFITRSSWGNLVAHDSTPEKAFSGWITKNEYKYLFAFNELFQFVKWEDKEPTSIQDVLESCEVVDNDD